MAVGATYFSRVLGRHRSFRSAALKRLYRCSDRERSHSRGKTCYAAHLKFFYAVGMQDDAGGLFIIPRLLSASTGPELNSCEARQGKYMGQPSHSPAANERPAGYMRYCSEASQTLIQRIST